MKTNVSILTLFVLGALLLIPAASIPQAEAAISISEIIDELGDKSGKILTNPTGITTDSDGNIYVIGSSSNNAFKITPDGEITEIIDELGDKNGNPLTRPRGITTDSNGNVYVTGQNSNNAFKITPNGEITEIIDELGDKSGSNPLNSPRAITTDSNGNVYVIGSGHVGVFKITPDRKITEIIDATGDGTGTGTGKTLRDPTGITTDSNGNIYVTGHNSNNVFKITPDRKITEIINSTGAGTGKILSNPFAITTDSNGNIYVTGSAHVGVFKITPSGVITEIIDRNSDKNGKILTNPYGITTDSSGNVYVVGHSSNNVFKITNGVITEIIDELGDKNGNPLNGPSAITTDSKGNIYVVGFNSNNVFKITSSADPSFSTSGDDNPGGCNNCEAPTLGINSKVTRIVENGFTYNGDSVDAERYFTPYPLITVNVGEPNTAVFRIYEDIGPQNIRHFSFGFGLDIGQIIGDSKAMIELDIDYDGTETVTITDPENALENVNVSTYVENCNNDGNDELKCLIVTIDHTFRAPLGFNIVATNVWDMELNAWQNYFNHGIEVVGESLNPPKEYDGINRGQIYHLTETSKTTAVDEFGNSWTLFRDTWGKDFVLSERMPDEPTNVMTRTHSEFTNYKQSQIDAAIVTLLETCPTCLDFFTDWDDSFAYMYPEIFESKFNNPEMQQKMLQEDKKAQKIMAQYFNSPYN